MGDNPMNNLTSNCRALGALLCMVATIMPAQADDDGPRGWPSQYFKDVKVMSYDGAVQSKGQCAIDWKAWNTAMDFVANQSVRLKLITEHDHWEQTKRLSAEASEAAANYASLLRGKNIAQMTEKDLNELRRPWDEARERSRKDWVPTLSFTIDTLELVSSCAGKVEANVVVVMQCSDNPLLNTGCKIRGTDKSMYIPSVEIWSDGSMISAPFD
jgi:hypothetical protein